MIRALKRMGIPVAGADRMRLLEQLAVQARPAVAAGAGRRSKAKAAASAAASSSAVRATEGENAFLFTLNAASVKALESLPESAKAELQASGHVDIESLGF